MGYVSTTNLKPDAILDGFLKEYQFFMLDDIEKGIKYVSKLAIMIQSGLNHTIIKVYKYFYSFNNHPWKERGEICGQMNIKITKP